MVVGIVAFQHGNIILEYALQNVTILYKNKYNNFKMFAIFRRGNVQFLSCDQ